MVVEAFVLQEVKAHGVGGVFYHTNEKSTMEIDFLVDDGASVIPVEVKASTNVKARSLVAYKEKSDVFQSCYP